MAIDKRLAKYAKDLTRLAKVYDKEAKADGVQNLSAFKTAKQRIKILTGSRTRSFTYAGLNRIVKSGNARALNSYIKVMETFVESPQASREARMEITEKAKQTYFQNTPNVDMKTVNDIYDVFATDMYHTLLEKGLISSEDVEEIVRNTQTIDDGDEYVSLYMETLKKVSNSSEYKKLRKKAENNDELHEYAYSIAKNILSKKLGL